MRPEQAGFFGASTAMGGKKGFRRQTASRKKQGRKRYWPRKRRRGGRGMFPLSGKFRRFATAVTGNISWEKRERSFHSKGGLGKEARLR